MTTTSAASPEDGASERAAGPPDTAEAGIESIYRGRFAQFLRVAQAITGDPDSARDAVQDAFAKALAGRRSLKSSASLEPWIWRTVVNAARDRRRAEGVRRAREAGSQALDGLQAPAIGESDPTIFAAVGSLPERQRHALFLRHYADLDYRTIGRILRMRPGTVAATLHTAQQSLRERLQEDR